MLKFKLCNFEQAVCVGVDIFKSEWSGENEKIQSNTENDATKFGIKKKKIIKKKGNAQRRRDRWRRCHLETSTLRQINIDSLNILRMHDVEWHTCVYVCMKGGTWIIKYYKSISLITIVAHNQTD